jgi:ABC-2 type transport system ATP-binding protein
MIKVQSLNKFYQSKQILNNINFTVPRGKTTAILGHNGAGKTTLIKCILQLTKSEGDISYNFGTDDIYKYINVQMQSSAYEKNVKVGEICDLYNGILAVNTDIDALLKEFDLSKHKNSYISTLSGGERQKLSILLTIINKPKVIIYDEITTGLDVMARKQIWQILNKIKEKEGITILLTSHFLDEIEYLADQLIILEKGEVKSVGTVQGFIDDMFGGFEKITCKLSDEKLYRDLQRDGIEIEELQDGTHLLRVEAKKVQTIMKKLYEQNVSNINYSAYTFEEAFVKKFGYTMNTEGGHE